MQYNAMGGAFHAPHLYPVSSTNSSFKISNRPNRGATSEVISNFKNGSDGEYFSIFLYPFDHYHNHPPYWFLSFQKISTTKKTFLVSLIDTSTNLLNNAGKEWRLKMKSTTYCSCKSNLFQRRIKFIFKRRN